MRISHVGWDCFCVGADTLQDVKIWVNFRALRGGKGSKTYAQIKDHDTLYVSPGPIDSLARAIYDVEPCPEPDRPEELVQIRVVDDPSEIRDRSGDYLFFACGKVNFRCKKSRLEEAEAHAARRVALQPA